MKVITGLGWKGTDLEVGENSQETSAICECTGTGEVAVREDVRLVG